MSVQEENKVDCILAEIIEKVPSPLLPIVDFKSTDPRLFADYGKVQAKQLASSRSIDLPLPAFVHFYREFIKIEREKQILIQQKYQLNRLKHFVAEQRTDAFIDGFSAGKRLSISVLRIHESRAENEAYFRKRVDIIQKERLATRNANRLLEKSSVSRKSRWNQEVQPIVYAALSSDREIVEGFDEDGKQPSPLPSATNAELIAVDNQQPSSSRISRVNDLNRSMPPSLPNEDDDGEMVLSPQRKPFSDLANVQERSVTKLINSSPVDPTKRPRTKKKKVY